MIHLRSKKTQISKYIFIFGLLFLGITSCNKRDKDDLEVAPPIDNAKINKVLIIGIDGCRSDALTIANTPNIDDLIENATYSLDARCLHTTSSGPGWTSMLSGVWQDKHGVVDNSYSGAQFSTYPHFFKYIETVNPQNRTVSIVQWNPINDMMASLEADVVMNADSDEIVKIEVIKELTNNNPTVLFMQLSNVDFAGHSSGYGITNSNYMSAIETVDLQVGNIIDALKRRESYSEENWLILLSTDHGGIGYGHGGPSDEERTIFVIVSGDSIPNKKIEKTTTQITVSPASNCLNSNYELKFDKTIVQVANQLDFNFGTNQDFSIEFRMRSKTPTDVGILAKKDWASGYNPGFVFSFNPTSKKLKVNVGDGTHRIDVESSEIADNEWHMVSATFDRDGLLKVYVNGIFSNSISMKSIENISNDLPFTIGADGKLKYHYTGFVAEVRVFNTLLNDNEIAVWKCKVLDDSHPKYVNLLSHWEITEGSGTVINDRSSNKYNGTVSNATWQDATVNTIETLSNYEATPRTVDVSITALNHLCIPIQSNWNLEGESLIHTKCTN